MAGKEDPMKNFGAVGSGSRSRLGGEEAAADWRRVHGGLTPCTGGHVLEKDADVISSKRKVDERPEDAAGTDGDVKWVEMPLEYIAWLLAQKREDYRVLTLEDYTLHRATAATDDNGSDCNSAYTQEDLAKHRDLVLQVKATDEAGKEDFFAFQEWARDTFERNGRVMVPEGYARRNQELIDEEWEKGMRELEMIDASN